MATLFFELVKEKLRTLHKRIEGISVENFQKGLEAESDWKDENPFSKQFLEDKYNNMKNLISAKMAPEITNFIKKLSISEKDERLDFDKNELDSTTFTGKSEFGSLAAAKSKIENDDFEMVFSKYYVDASENYYENFDNYLTMSLRFLNMLPLINWEHDIKVKEISLPPTIHKKTLILDLDETLIHSDIDFYYQNHDYVLKFKNDDFSENIIPLFVRPFMKEFLEFASNHFEVICFTASCKYYADAILDYIEKGKHIFSKRLYRESCLFIHPGIYIKDLSVLKDRDPQNIVIVDNSLFSFANNLSNGILISSFYNDSNDTVLYHLQNYLQDMILSAEDVRTVNAESFQFESMKSQLKTRL
jgi:Dullard-like phosphatase family protein